VINVGVGHQLIESFAKLLAVDFCWFLFHASNGSENACGLQPSRAVTFVIRHRHFLFAFLEPAVRIAVPTGVFEVSREMARGEEGGGAYER
jgi:hypothetical protein